MSSVFTEQTLLGPQASRHCILAVEAERADELTKHRLELVQ